MLLRSANAKRSAHGAENSITGGCLIRLENNPAARELCFQQFLKASARCLALPDHYDAPVSSSQLPANALIPGYVLPKLTPPERAIALWMVREAAARMTMPEASVHEDDCAVSNQDNVGPTGECSRSESKAIAKAVQC